MKKITYMLGFALLCVSVGCSAGETSAPGGTDSENDQRVSKEKNGKEKTESTALPDNDGTGEGDPGKTKSAKPDSDAQLACEKVNTGDNMILKSQTFAIDFKPFEKSCFVTAHHPEYDDPPLGSVFSIYKNGKEVYKFDSRFHADAATCWVRAVSFQDLNADGLQDIVVIGTCGAKSGQINANEFYANTGTDFKTNTPGNDKLEDFKTVKDVANFVKTNKELYFK